MVTVLCHSFTSAALAVVIALCGLLLTACAGEPRPLPETRAPALTLPPPATLLPTPAPGAATQSVILSPQLEFAITAPERADCPEHGYCDRLEVGGQLTAAAWLDDDRMYLADYSGRIRLLNVKTREIRTAVAGLTIPQGLTVLKGHLYVSDMGNVCELLGTRDCMGNSTFTRREYLDFVKWANARILSYPIGGNGDLGRQEVVVDRIPSYDRDHSPNGLTNDGQWVYASIGHPARRVDPTGGFFHSDRRRRLSPRGDREDLMGSIIRFRPGDTEVAVWATGLRNTYGISIAPDGTIYGADNDYQVGLADCCQREELNAIVRDGFYGFPFYGTNEAPPEAGVIEPVAVLAGTASTFAYANPEGVYVAYLALDGSGDGFVVDRFDYATGTPERIFSTRTHTTAILERNGLLYLASFDGNVHIINPDAAPVRVVPGLRDTDDYLRSQLYTDYYVRSPFHTDAYVKKVIGAGGPSVISPGEYAVYIADGRLIYAKTSCEPEDNTAKFFLHIVPVRGDDLPKDSRKDGFVNSDFWFSRYGWRSGDGCYAVRELPGYAISSIRTGQFVRESEGGYRIVWEAEYHFER